MRGTRSSPAPAKHGAFAPFPSPSPSPSPFGSAPGTADTRIPWAALLALVAVAAVLRAIDLGTELWLDEMITSVLTIRPPARELLTVYKGDNQHPLYSLLAYASVALFGDTPWALRLPAMAFGIASVPMLYLLGRRVAAPREALFAAALLAVSYHHVWFSQNARGYTMLAFWAILATDLLLRGIREERRSAFVGYAVVAALGIYTHLTMVFLVAAHVLVCAWMSFAVRGRRLGWKLPALGFVLGGMLTLALYGPILVQVVDWFTNRPSRLLGVSTPAWALGEGWRILRIGFGAGWSMIAAGVVFAVGLVSYARRSPLVLALFVLPGVTTVAGALFGRGTMYPRFFFFLIGFAMLIVVRGASVIGELAARVVARGRGEARLASGIGGALVALMILASVLSLRYNYAYPKQPFLAAAAHVDANANPGEPVAVVNASRYAYVEYYRRAWTPLTQDDALNALRKAGQPVWLVYTFPRYLALEAPAVMETIRAECGNAVKFDGTVGDGDVFVCVLPPA